MKVAEIYSEPARVTHGYVWRWRAGDAQSSKSFEYYYECVEDAKRAGYEVQQESASGNTAPGHGAVSNMT